jgi:hypothetical protein
MTTAYATAPASEGRVAFIRTLLAERVVPADAAARLNDRLEKGLVNTEQAIQAIEWLKRQPNAGVVAARFKGGFVPELPAAEVVPAGRYAVATEAGATNALAFYKVDRPTEGKWAGKVFVKLVVSDEEQRLSFAATKAVLAKIAEVGAEQASAAYGHEIGECGVCGRTLTNDESRERGIGPICADKMGW